MLQLRRAEAVELLSFVQMFALSEDQLRSKTEDALAEEELSSASDELGNFYLRRYLMGELEIVTNNYLEQSLNEAGYGVSIFDAEPFLHACPVCDYETLEKKGEYCICPVCFWEDDGTTSAEQDRRSPANRMTLSEARANYQNVGAIKGEFVSMMYNDRHSRYRTRVMGT